MEHCVAWNARRCFGKIAGDDRRVYFTHTEELFDVLRLLPGQRVTFENSESPRGPRAGAVRVVEVRRTNRDTVNLEGHRMSESTPDASTEALAPHELEPEIIDHQATDHVRVLALHNLSFAKTPSESLGRPFSPARRNWRRREASSSTSPRAHLPGHSQTPTLQVWTVDELCIHGAFTARPSP